MARVGRLQGPGRRLLGLQGPGRRLLGLELRCRRGDRRRGLRGVPGRHSRRRGCLGQDQGLTGLRGPTGLTGLRGSALGPTDRRGGGPGRRWLRGSLREGHRRGEGLPGASQGGHRLQGLGRPRGGGQGEGGVPTGGTGLHPRRDRRHPVRLGLEEPFLC